METNYYNWEAYNKEVDTHLSEDQKSKIKVLARPCSLQRL
jgi:hypothetical protein